MPLAVGLVRIHGKLRWRCFPTESYWVGVCDPLKLTVQGDTWADLMQSIAETLNAMLAELLKSQDLDAFLRTQGWTASGPIPTHPEDVRFDVPFIPAIVG